MPTVTDAQPTAQVGDLRARQGAQAVFGELLKLHRERTALTQLEVASKVGVKRPTFTQWEAGRYLPAEGKVRELDRILGAGGELISAAAKIRPRDQLHFIASTETAIKSGAVSQLRMMKDIRRAFLKQLQFDPAGRPIGWRHDLVPSDQPPSTLSTAYGLKVLAMLGGPDATTPAVVDALISKAVRAADGRLVGWAARTQFEPRLETTATALDALLHAGVPIPVADVERMVRDLVDDTARERPFILTAALEPLLRVAPDADITTELVQALLDCRVSFGGRKLWPEKRLPRDQPLLGASVAHTARAVTVLRNSPEDVVGDAVASAEEWLVGVDDLNGVSERIPRRLNPEKIEEFTVHHFTSAWVARAFAGGNAHARHRIEYALKRVWDRYDSHSHFWAWGNGDVPVWMLADAVAALQETALALRPTPFAPDSG